ncbi:hypothetical protein CLV59_106354 [Chitinophaga dinghuensis]|uniref:Uncharacterized protein n=1 Tax=Chitinophaga dinghuensis TaxID=1539050 RepID=A0A327VVH1_9BACT|nr:hypothetical protein [Chitinophaga dinghuensis]RAJ79293.1 hypothetical protein CLV59_106354 [Chitinophaga dinghuensis]
MTESNQETTAEESMSKEDLKYTLERLYKCRDLEISNLWQRSVFLSVFLILCFTAYGYLALEILKMSEQKLVFHLVCLGLTAVGAIFSVIWILMGKASKAWYEVYETAITKFEHSHFKILGLPKKNIMGNMEFPADQKNNSIFKTSGGAYSPSKINIGIGVVSLFLWMILGAIHLFFGLANLQDCNAQGDFYIVLGMVTIVFVTIIIIMCFTRTNFLRSNFLE